MKLNFLTSFIIANLKHDTTKNNIISTSPGGKKGLYYLGSLNYIKNNYDLSDFSFLGSGGFGYTQFYPKVLYNLIKKFDNILSILPLLFAARMIITLEKLN